MSMESMNAGAEDINQMNLEQLSHLKASLSLEQENLQSPEVSNEMSGEASTAYNAEGQSAEDVSLRRAELQHRIDEVSKAMAEKGGDYSMNA